MNDPEDNTGLNALISALPPEQRDEARADLARFTRILARSARTLATDPTAYAQFQALTKRKT